MPEDRPTTAAVDSYFADLGDPDYGNAYFAKTSLLTSQPDVVTRWMKADIKGWQYFCANPAATAKLTWDLYHTQTQAVLSNEEASAKVSVPLVNGGAAAAHGVLWVDGQAFSEVLALYQTAKIITTKVDVAKVYTQQFLVAAGDKP